MKKFEFDDLRKFAKEWNIKIERKLLIQPPTIAARFPPDKALFIEFCSGLRFMENLRVKNLIEEKENFLGRLRMYEFLKKKPAEHLTVDELELLLKLSREFGYTK